MMRTIAIILALLWGIGLLTSYTMGGYIHALLVLAVVFLFFGFNKERKSASYRPYG
jgi:uncharacterized protein (DUF58 family)